MEYLNLRNQTNKYASVKYVLSHIIKYRSFSIAFAIIIREIYKSAKNKTHCQIV
jgi:hypothetical protein